MTKKTDPKIIGGFVPGLVSLISAGVLTFGGGQYSETRRRLEPAAGRTVGSVSNFMHLLPTTRPSKKRTRERIPLD
jgi:hypothetical protein